MDTFCLLWRAPHVNPITQKARSIPFLNPVSTTYGRTFFFSWFGFMIAFWSWYAFPPLLADVIAADIHMTHNQVANSNIIALTATLLVRLIAGPSCDRFGPRLTFAGCLLAGAVPTFLAGTVQNASGLYALRFFIGVLGGSFVPCQVWTTGFFDTNVVGLANALAGGLGNLGGGITYFVMPAVYKALVDDGLPGHKAWRVAFVVPGVLIVFVAACLLVLCEDTPTGAWAKRHAAAEESLRRHDVVPGVKTGTREGDVVDIRGELQDVPKPSPMSSRLGSTADIEKSSAAGPAGDEKKHGWKDNEAQQTDAQMYTTASTEIIQKPSLTSVLRIMFSLQTLVPAACYFCTFGAELSINSVLGNYYLHAFPSMTLQASGNWAAMFGLLNGVARPLGGYISDLAYRRTHSVWAKKAVLHTYGVLTGAFLIVIGALDPRDVSTMMGLVGALAVVLEGGNGADFGLVPHVHPHANGVVSGFTGAMGNLGGIVFAIIFRYNGKDYGRVFWIIGVVVVAVNLAVSWIRPVAKKAA
ncbi:major facilitator superfamily domain-containing protein [Boeremia exigua]|uniref:major facilitator superfamily domain-containing protein n=1 Tax=Boeremia exigua TaxID=749465 RepID=UPI001E8D0F9E|nr:major facilitator superfamily domain-containing protein [Boeremia exigua]KAH6637569.1 major facilitator superfamily domain-containing protein [Boeremia exigua]